MAWGRMLSNSTTVAVEYNPPFPVPGGGFQKQLRQWCQDNSKGEFEVQPGRAPRTIDVLFEREDDATFFSLKWS